MLRYVPFLGVGGRPRQGVATIEHDDDDPWRMAIR